MKNKNPSKGVIIAILIITALLLIVVPVEQLRGKPPILGAVLAKVFVKPLATNQTCNITMESGWNLISIACQPDNTSLLSMLQPLSGNYTSIHSYESNQSDKWKTYNPNLPSWVEHDLSEISNQKGYWINLIATSTINISGVLENPVQIPLMKGWNLVGYPSDNAKTPVNALTTIGSSYSIIWAYNATSDTYLYYNPNLGSGTLDYMINSWGYWINMTQNDNWWVT